MIVTERFNFANRVEGDLVITIVPDATNEVGQPHTFTVTVQQDLGDGIDSDGNGSPFDPVVGAAVMVTLTSINGALAVPSGPFNGITNVNGQFFVTFTSATAGKVIGNAFVTHVVNGTPISRDTDPATATPAGPGGSGPATKTYVDAKIIIAPDDTNEVGDPHTFTVTVFADNGDGIDNDGMMGTFDAVGAGDDVTVTLTSINGASAVPAGPFAGVTNASGQFSVTFTSATAGQVIGSATSNVDVGGLVLVRSTDGTGNNSGPARKTFVDAKIIIAPDDTNAVGDPHTFTVTVFADNGDGIDNDGTMGTFDAVGAGEDVTVTLTSINGASAVPPGPFVGVTNANGQFSVTFTSATAGQVIGSATSNVDVGGLVLVRTTDGTGNNSGPARKTFVDAKITISPDGVNPVGQPHTFTVIVWADNGDGIDNDGQMGTFDRVGAGQTVTVTLDGIGGAIPDVIAPINLPPADPTVIVRGDKRARRILGHIYIGDNRTGNRNGDVERQRGRLDTPANHRWNGQQ